MVPLELLLNFMGYLLIKIMMFIKLVDVNRI